MSPTSVPEPAHAPVAAGLAKPGRTWALVLLFLAGVLNMFDRQIINILGQSIKTDLHITDAQLGLLTGTAFGLLYAAFGIPLGRLADRVNRIKLISAALVVWSSFTALCGTTASYVTLLVCRMGVGIGEAGSQPASTALIPDLFGEARRVSAMSMLLVGGPAGAFLGLLVGGYVGAAFGWRAAFLVAGAPGLILALVMLVTLRDPPRGGGRALPPRVSLLKMLRVLAGRRKFRGLVVGLICSSFIAYASGAWLPPFFIRHHGLPMQQTGLISAFAVGLGGIVGTLGAGFLCDRLRARVPQVETKMAMASLALSAPLLLLVVLCPDRTAAVIGWFAFNLAAFAWQGPTITLIQKAAGIENRASALAVASALAMTLSLALGVPLVGLLSDSLTGRAGSGAIGDALAVGVGLAAAVGLIAHGRVRYIATEAGA